MSSTKDQTKRRRFWQAREAEELVSPKPVDLTQDLSHLDSEQRNERKLALKNMLVANETRQQDAMRARRPSMALGQRVAILSGPFKGLQGVVLDADFINNRVLLDIDDMPDPEWMSFKRIGSV